MHGDVWIAACDTFQITIDAKGAQAVVMRYRARQAEARGSTVGSSDAARSSSHEAFVDALIELFVAEDLSFNLIESPHLQALIKMLHEELSDFDIPHRTTLQNRLSEVFTELFLAVTTHWIQHVIKSSPSGPKSELKLRVDLIGFHQIPGRHNGEHLAQTFLHILKWIEIAEMLG
ncbi:hypothetical protein BDR03DRAFT_1008793 [Suillus americanus]|nr:hypothetical protein BDR03DRAFT_1008793 [Suillus americanus]